MKNIFKFTFELIVHSNVNIGWKMTFQFEEQPEV